mgnify:FL=1
MFCKNCGTELLDDSRFCHKCGAFTGDAECNATPPIQSAAPNPAIELMRKAFSSSRFLAVAIVISAGVTISFLSSILDNGAFSVGDVLLTVSCWLLYAAARGETVDNRFTVPVMILSVTSKVVYIINWVLIGLLGAVSVLFAFAGMAVGSLDISETIVDSLRDVKGFEQFDAIIDPETFGDFLLKGGMLIISVLLLLFVAVYVVLNIFCFGSFRRTAKSFEVACKTGACRFEKLGAASAWLMVYGIFGAVAAAGSMAGSVLGGFGQMGVAVGLIMLSGILKTVGSEE